ncbi:MAG: hemerythrin domain-containing protein [Rhodospirillales bacterium]|nr:hemerythrin domain-containing protein [Rhodospirillales bacterium]
MDIFEVLHQDHETARGLFTKIEGAGGKQEREGLFQELKDELLAHSHAEERVFYSQLKGSPDARKKVEEGIHEHHEVEELLEKMASMDAGSQEWLSRVRELKEMVEHHVQEEEGEVFTKARSILPGRQVEEMAGQMQRAKKEEMH